MIKDSGERREFESGAVRDITEDKGRCDLLPLDVISDLMIRRKYRNILINIENFKRDGIISHLLYALIDFASIEYGIGFRGQEAEVANMILEVAKHYEEGAKKYKERNWEKGIPVHCYIDSATRHLLKHIRGDKDEHHERAFVWNILGCLWTICHKPELNEYPIREE